ncbi:MAG: family 16 glycosylhydrolase [Pseudomonadota bacterium]
MRLNWPIEAETLGRLPRIRLIRICLKPILDLGFAAVRHSHGNKISEHDMRRSGLLSQLLAASFIGAPHAFAQSDASFFEPFDALDRDRWFISSGWANGDHQSCLWHRDRVAINDGVLALSLTADAKEDRDLSCAEIQTNARFGYGTFEVRMNVPYATGMNANMFTFIGAPQDRPHNEIDFEFINRQSPTLQTNFHTAQGSENTDLTAMPDDGAYRIYSFIWEPDRIRWFIDGDLIRETTGADLPNEPQKLYLSLWSTETLKDWMGVFEAADAPQTLEVDWVAFTAAGEPCAFDQSVLCQSDIEARP